MLRSINRKMVSALSVIVLGLVSMSANSACFWVLHQNKFPSIARKLRRF